jgi:hypothetical protein
MDVAVRPVRRGWLAPCLVLPALIGVASAWSEEVMSDHQVLFVAVFGALSVAATAGACEATRRQWTFLLATTFVFTASLLGLVIVGELLWIERDRWSAGGTRELAAGTALVGLVGPAIVGARLHRKGASSDAHHGTLQRAALVAIASACLGAGPLAPTGFFWLPPLTLSVAVALLAVVAQRDVALERRLLRILDDLDPEYSVVPAGPDDPIKPPTVRWASEVMPADHAYLVRRSDGAGYREPGRREEPVASVTRERRERAPRVVLWACAAAAVAGVVVVVASLAVAPAVSVPVPIRSLHGAGTRYRLLPQKARDARVYVVEPPIGARLNAKPPWAGWDPSRRLLSPDELFTRLPHRSAHEAARHALLALIPGDGATLSPWRPPRITGGELELTYGSHIHSTEGVTCTVTLSTGVLGPCTHHRDLRPPAGFRPEK